MQFDPNSDQELEYPILPDPLPKEELPEITQSDLFAVELVPPDAFVLPTGEEAPILPTDSMESSNLQPSLPQSDFPSVEEPREISEDDLELQELRKLYETPVDSAAHSEDSSQEQLPELEESPKPTNTPDRKKASRTRAVKKGRPRRKKGEGLLGIPNILVTVVWCALTLLISLTLGRLVWVCAAEVLAFGREDKNVTITIYEEDTIDDITKKLARAELIRYPGLFKLYAQFAVDEGEIRPGMWDLNTKYDYHALVKMMAPSSSRDVVKITIPEGYSCRQIFALLEENKVCTVQDITSYAASGELDGYWFLDNVSRGDPYCLEGFLFPDTYEFYKNDTPKNVLSRMLNNFNNRFDEDLRWKIQTLNTHLTDLMRRNGSGQEYINAHQFDVQDVVNVAAMIEKETSSVQEGYTIASVIYNRLFCWGSNPPYLNIDATIVYALNGKTDLTLDDLRVNSPFNTYTNQGLPPRPIANPGLASLKAALEPTDTNYYFYVLDPAAGSHHFSTTQAEHEAFRATLGG